MPTLKCIGGPLDGKEFSFSEREIKNWRSGDAVRLPKKNLSVTDFDPNIAPKNQSITYHLYVIAKMHFHGTDGITFLREASMTDYQAIVHQMSK